MHKDTLPQGDFIRQLLIKSNVTNSNINILLREKGVFIGHNEKNNSVPLLMKSIVSPKDYITLYETQKTKEESIKYRTSSIKCKSDFDLSDVLDKEIDVHNLILDKHTYRPNYKVVGNPTFYFEDENTAIFDYQIERENLLSDWTNNKTYHNGSIMLKRVSENDIQISVQQNSTSKETIEVNNIIMNQLKEKLFQKSIINSNDDVITVKFNHFDNTSRIQFFYSFISDLNIYLKFTSITDIDLYLDEDIESHADVKLFLDEIDNLKLNGKGLQNHALLKKMEYFPKLIFGAVKLRYKLNYSGIEGIAIINIGFPEYVKSKDINSDFQISIDLILNKRDKNARTENSIRKKLLELFEIKKVESYEKFKII
ncbi:GapS4b family protein [Elizabethkingia anophelis]|uniref:GapS4b family protein n=1 Tax=Elizabethkingia anophelis TaxID=1117645 RepID=UPI003891527C